MVRACFSGDPEEEDPARQMFGMTVGDVVAKALGIKFLYEVYTRSNSRALKILSNDTVDIFLNDPSLNWKRLQVRKKNMKLCYMKTAPNHHMFHHHRMLMYQAT